MKKVLIIICLLFITGCTDIRKLTYDDIVNSISTRKANDNTFRTGYSYYLPRGMQVSDSTLYNQTLSDSKYKYYLYVDIVSYYKKVTKEYDINNNAFLSKKLDYDGKFGYAEVNLLKNNKYIVEIMYNYAKIEVIVDKINLNEAMLSIINILKSVEYNDSIIANLKGENILNFSEEEFNIFNTKGSESNYLTVDDDITQEDEKIHDPDMIN